MERNGRPSFKSRALEVGDTVRHKLYEVRGTVISTSRRRVSVAWENGITSIHPHNWVFYEPTPEEIQRRAAMCRQMWSDREWLLRSGAIQDEVEIMLYSGRSSRRMKWTGYS